MWSYRDDIDDELFFKNMTWLIYVLINTLINVDKCLDITVIVIRSIINYCISIMFKKEEFYLHKMYIWY